jgi:hypothetical protein
MTTPLGVALEAFILERRWRRGRSSLDDVYVRRRQQPARRP